MERQTQHVVKSAKGWAIRKGGAVKVTQRYSTQEEAIERAKEIARNQHAELYIHGRDGLVKEKISYKEPSFQTHRSVG